MIRKHRHEAAWYGAPSAETRRRCNVLLKRALPIIFLVVLACCAAAVPAASANRPHPVFFRHCSGILNSDDFGDNLEEVSPTITFRDTKFTDCKFGGDSANGVGPLKQFSKGEIGLECLAVAINNLSHEIPEAEGDCYRLATETALFITGHISKRLFAKMEKGFRRRSWDRGYSRIRLRHVGNDAGYGYSGDKGFGYLQVLNVSVEIETDEIHDVPRLLKEAARSL